MTIFDTATGLFVIVGGLAGASGILYAATQKNAISTFKADNEALRGLNTTLKAVNEEQRKQIDTLQGGISVLRDTIGAGPQLAQLATDIATQHKEVLRELGNVAGALANISNNIDGTKIGRQARRLK